MTLRLLDDKNPMPDLVSVARSRLRQCVGEFMTAAIAAEDDQSAREAQIISLLLERERQ